MSISSTPTRATATSTAGRARSAGSNNTSLVKTDMEHKVVPRDEWLIARKALLAREKEFTRARDELSRQRRELPWVKVDKPYRFDGPDGSETLSDLFAGRSQLIVYHFM